MLKIHVKYDHPETRTHLNAEPGPLHVDPASPEGDGDDSCKCDSDEEKPPKLERLLDERFIEGHEICPKCTRPFVTKQRLNYHLLDHDQLITCLYCPWKFPVGPGRRRHQRRMHGDKAEPVCFTCSVCKETFETKSILFLHKKNSHTLEPTEDVSKAEGPVKKSELEHCHVCDKMIQPSKFEAHLLHHADDAYGGKTLSENALNTAASNPESLQCPMCDVTSATQEQHRAHIAQRHVQTKSSSFRCDGCSQAFANVEAINRHSCPGKEKEKQWKNCKHCGQNLSSDIEHVCDNECPICHKIFKSARGQRLHIQHKHDSAESHSAGADDPANSETRSSGSDSAGAYESVVIKEEQHDGEAVKEDDEPETAEAEPAEPEMAEPEMVEPETAEPRLEAETEDRSTPKELPTTTSNSVSDEPSSSTSPNPSESTPIQQGPLSSAPDAGKPVPVKGTPKIRLRPNSALISGAPNVISTTPKLPTLVVRPPPPYRPPLFESPTPVPVQPVVAAEETKSIIIKKNSGPGFSFVVTNVKHPSNSAANTSVPAAKTSFSEARVDHSNRSNSASIPVSPSLSNIPPLAHIGGPTLNVSVGGVSVSVNSPVSSIAMPTTFATTTSSPAFNPSPNSSQIPSTNIIPNPVSRIPSVIINPKPFVSPQPEMRSSNPSNSIRCVRISSLQTPPAPGVGTPPQISPNQSNIDHGYGKVYNPGQPSPVRTEFNTFQPSSGPREENLLRDVLLGRRTDQDFL